MIVSLETRIFGENARRTITDLLNKAPRLDPTAIGDKYSNFETKLRQMESKDEINEYENEAIRLIKELRPIRDKLSELVILANEISDDENNSTEIQEKRKKVLNLIFDLEKYTDENADELTKSVYNLV